MRNILEKIKGLDVKILIGAGLGLATVVLLVFFLIIGGKAESNSDKHDKDFDITSESEEVDGFYQTEVEEVLESTEETEITNNESQEIEETETSESEVQEIESPEIQGNSGSASEVQKEDDKNSTNGTESSETTTPSRPVQTPSSSEDSETNETQTPAEPETPPVTEPYTVNVVSAGGHKLYNVKVHAYTDKAMTNLFTTAATNSKGVATLQLEQGKEYFINLSNVPVGYKLNASYSLSGTTTSIVLDSSVVTGQEYPSKKLKVGNVMYDFTVPSADGSEITLSEVVKSKELVVLNFWYVNCQFCVMEFPYMSSAYNLYKDRVEIIALDPFDDMNAVHSFLEENPLPFKVATCDTNIPNLFGIDAYPVSVIIDKYGVIREIEKGAILETNGFVSLFEKYL